MWHKWSRLGPHATFPGWESCLREQLIKDELNRWQNHAGSWEGRERKRHSSSSVPCSLLRSLLPSGFQLLSGSTQPHESTTEPSVEVSDPLCGLVRRGLRTILLFSAKALSYSHTYSLMVGMHWDLGDEQECFALLPWHTPQSPPAPLRPECL